MVPASISGAVPIELDRPRTLKADLNALVMIEERTGLNMFTDALEIKSARHVRAFLWALLRHEDPDLTEEQVGSFITAENLNEISGAITRAFGAGMPEPSEAEGASEVGKGRASRSTG